LSKTVSTYSGLSTVSVPGAYLEGRPLCQGPHLWAMAEKIKRRIL